MEDEKIIADWVRNMAAAGFPVANKELLDSVQHSLNRDKRNTPFVNNRPTITWIPKFKKRHNLSLRTPETLDLGKALITPEDLKKWRDRVENYLKFVIVPLCTSAVARPLLSQLMSQSFISSPSSTFATTHRSFLLYFEMFSFYQHIFSFIKKKRKKFENDSR